MSDLVDGRGLPWDIVSGDTEPPFPTPSTASELPPPVRREPTEPITTKRLVAGGLFVAGAVVAHWRRGRS